MAQAGVRARLAAQGPPERVDAADQVDAAVFRVVLEEVDQLLALLGRPGAVLEPEAPEQHDRLALVVQVARVLADLDLVAEELPVVHDHRRRGAAARREVEHHRPDAALAVASFADAGQHRLTCRDRVGLAASPMNRLRKTPSIPYCRIHRVCSRTGPLRKAL